MSGAAPLAPSYVDAMRRSVRYMLLTLSLAGSQVVWSLELACVARMQDGC